MAKIKLPKNYGEVTVGQAMAWETTPDPLVGLADLAGLTMEEVRNLPRLVVDSAITHLQNRVFSSPIADFRPVVMIGGVKYGFIVDWEKITVGEWVDLEHYTGQDPWHSADAVLSILYRPCKWHDERTGLYVVEPYEDTQNREKMLDFPASLYVGAVGFFLNTAISSANDGLYSTQQKLRRMRKKAQQRRGKKCLRNISLNVGGGMRRLWKRLKETFSGLTR